MVAPVAVSRPGSFYEEPIKHHRPFTPSLTGNEMPRMPARALVFDTKDAVSSIDSMDEAPVYLRKPNILRPATSGVGARDSMLLMKPTTPTPRSVSSMGTHTPPLSTSSTASSVNSSVSANSNASASSSNTSISSNGSAKYGAVASQARADLDHTMKRSVSEPCFGGPEAATEKKSGLKSRLRKVFSFVNPAPVSSPPPSPTAAVVVPATNPQPPVERVPRPATPGIVRTVETVQQAPQAQPIVQASPIAQTQPPTPIELPQVPTPPSPVSDTGSAGDLEGDETGNLFDALTLAYIEKPPKGILKRHQSAETEQLEPPELIREPSLASSSSSLSSNEPTTPTESHHVMFARELYICSTWHSMEYDRRGEVATCNRLTPWLAQQIKDELNEYKNSEMLVHEKSRDNTHFF
ncbi:uncharacterized protein V1510DRAFT_422798 [Dipodascopsis tothii]|uniref:uncharacterized protein n=1 Tax=Dipodascopsis tothii TaxID=44089 RepID=UPI0034CFD884